MRVGSTELLGGIVDGADGNHRPLPPQPDKIVTRRCCGESLTAQNRAEHRRVAPQLALEVVGDLLRGGNDSGNAIESTVGYSNVNSWIRLDVLQPIRSGSTRGSDEEGSVALVIDERRHTGLA